MSTSSSSMSSAAASINNGNPMLPPLLPPPATASSNSTTTPPPPTLEQKLELLEARFTQPLPSQFLQQHQHHQQQQCSNLSEHSFSFPASNNAACAAATAGGGGGTAVSSPLSLSNNTTSTSLELVHQAAAKHMRKVASSASFATTTNNNNTSNNTNNTTTASLMMMIMSPLHSHSHTSSSNNKDNNNNNNTNDSQQTLVTGHHASSGGGIVTVTTEQRSLLHHRVVAESPPPPSTGMTTNACTAAAGGVAGVVVVTAEKKPNQQKQKPHVARNLLGRTNSTTTTSTGGGDGNVGKDTTTTTTPSAATTTTTKQRKSQQPKRKVSSIQDSSEMGIGMTMTVATATPTPTTVAAATTIVAKTNVSPSSKRSRKTGAAGADVAAAANSTNTTNHHSRDAIPGRSSSSSTSISISTRSRSPRTSRNTNTINGTTTTLLSEHSRERSNPGVRNSNVISHKPPANNKRIHDFFSAVASRNNNHQTIKKNIHSRGNGHTTTNTTAVQSVHHGTTMTSSTSTTATSPGATTTATTLPDWESHCHKLQQQLQDREEQLKAVTNNKTILHTALQAALTKTQHEFQSVQETFSQKQHATSHVLEDLLRWKSQQQAKQVRETLAADGARLGKVVYSRAGMRAVESWEEGYATKDLQQRKEDWKRRMRTLLERQEAFQQEQEQHKENNNNNTADVANNNHSNNIKDVVALLDAQQTKEAMEMHMETLRREEHELVAADQSLNDEKASHIRALKRVEAEASSRFQHRPKLHDRYVLDRLLGKGGFSEVWRAFDLQELREVAVKIHQLDPRWPDSKKDNYTKHVTREYEIHRDVRHPRIVSLFDVFEIDANSFATVLECCKGTDLDTLLKSKKRLSERHARSILLQILSGMQYLSQPSGSRQGIIHYDLKPGNILFDEAGDAKITDFGLSKIVDTPDPAESMELTSQGAGTYWYLPPECFFIGEQVRISNKVDVWSIGVIFYQMLYGRRPFGEGKTQDKILADHTMLNAQEVHIPEKPAVSDAGKDFLRLCLTYDQAFRPSVAQLCDNAYVLQDAAAAMT